MKLKFAMFSTAIMFLTITLLSCGGGNNSTPSTPAAAPTASTAETKTDNGNPSYDPKRGTGKFTKVDIPATLDAAKASAGEKVFNVKCSSCHKLTDEKLVGPGWKGVTGRHSAEWIMNFSTNTDEMIDKDPKAQAMLEICLVRMPNQNLSDDDARNIYEFMRKNDGVK
ncbi:MAG: cytochrome c [Bacteroidetes bacterium]|nr:cytochrome c [Bacteroidota bacterium]MBS1649542.1 cytochrome c [Bacteroidota bacterium]